MLKLFLAYCEVPTKAVLPKIHTYMHMKRCTHCYDSYTMYTNMCFAVLFRVWIAKRELKCMHWSKFGRESFKRANFILSNTSYDFLPNCYRLYSNCKVLRSKIEYLARMCSNLWHIFFQLKQSFTAYRLLDRLRIITPLDDQPLSTSMHR